MTVAVQSNLDEKEGKMINSYSSAVHYVNGVAATKNDAIKVAKQLATLIGDPVTLHYNGTTPTARIAALSMSAAGAGVFAQKGVGGKEVALIGGGALLAFCLIDYYQLQQEKNKRAEAIAASLRNDLRNPYVTATLVLHSQGADIGLRAINLLSLNERARLQVVTMGGMVAIPNGLVGKVVNFQHEADLVSQGAQLLFRSFGEKQVTPIPSKGDLVFHGAEAYVQRPEVRKTIKSFSEPKIVSYNV